MISLADPQRWYWFLPNPNWLASADALYVQIQCPGVWPHNSLPNILLSTALSLQPNIPKLSEHSILEESRIWTHSLPYPRVGCQDGLDQVKQGPG
jgi:hypothetical protein